MKTDRSRKRRRRRRCRHCRELYTPDPRNLRHQEYCAKAECRGASKAARQRRWLSKPENRDYFRGPANVDRVRRWRKVHPGYWRGKGAQSSGALQDDLSAKRPENIDESHSLNADALQDDFWREPALLVGLIASLSGHALQDDIAATSRRFVRLGQDILGKGPGNRPKGGR